MKKSKAIYDKFFRIIIHIMIINIIVLIIIVLYDFYIVQSDKKISQELENIISEVTEENDDSENKLSVQLEKLKNRNRNTEIKGWIQIEDTNINYPILQGIDNQYYLNHNYKKQKSTYGSIFLSYKVDLEGNNQNYLIYGHNVSDGSMFNNLRKYYHKDFYEAHKTITLVITGEEEYRYEIISVFKSKVFEERQKDVFEYYNYIDLNDESVYSEYIYNVKRLSLYYIELSAEYGEQLITLSTCDVFQENKRMVIVAKKIL